MNNPDFYFKYWESIRKKGIYMANQNTSVSEMIAKNNAKKKGISDKIVPIILGIIAICSILATVGIIVTLLTETITFFTRVPQLFCSHHFPAFCTLLKKNVDLSESLSLM